ncbi:Cytochrome P450 monooxygenase aneD [Paramyrothecium foliicola]|nr:Cytochrome P450 monooxygenase aneD [Paramyrothecium foliicola]
MALSTASLVLGIAGLLVLYFISRRSRSSRLPLPPGPPTLPIIGNVHQAPKSHAWKQYTEWGREHGPVIHLNMLGQHVIVLSTAQAAHDLLAKRGATFSDRPKMFVAQELALKHMNILLMDYNDRFRLHQRLEGTVLNQTVSAKYRDFQSMESKQLLYDIMQTADGPGSDVRGHIERAIASTVFALFYGFRIQNHLAPELLEVVALDKEFAEFVKVGAFLVDSFPFLNALPEPLAPWKAKAESYYQRQSKLHVTNLMRGLNEPGWTFAKQINSTIKDEKIAMPLEELAFEFGTMCDAAIDGTVETMRWFLIACITQDNGFVARAKKDIDDVVGRDRLPTFDDQARLPYISAIVEEVLRWRPAVAGGVPHFTKTESTYNGYMIPANSVVLPNHWAISRQETDFGPDTDSFIPDRWLDADAPGRIKNLPVAGFGYGRRLCPGRHFARNLLWISMARIIWAFDIKAGLSENGEPTVVDSVTCIDGVIVRSLPFKASMTPRDEKARKIIEGECYTHNEDLAAILTRIGADLPPRQTASNEKDLL